MIGIDINVPLRHGLEDDAVQSSAATALLTDEGRLHDPALVDPIAPIEFCRTLGRKSFSKPGILALLDVPMSSKRIAFTDDRAMRAAIRGWRTGRADLPDYLIDHLNRQAGAAGTVTFDATAAEYPGLSLLQV